MDGFWTPWRSLSGFLAALRWVAAWLVVLGHMRTQWFVALSDMDTPNLAVMGFVWLAGLGHSAVMAFFLLSGYLVGGRLLDAQAAGHGYARYAIDRITRLYVVLLPAFAVSYLLVVLGSLIVGDPTILDREENSLYTLLANMAFLQGVAATDFAHNLPLWSLSNEFWYYVMAPLLVIAVLTKRLDIRLGLVLMLAAMCYLLGSSIAVYSLVWLLGMSVRLGWLPRIERRFAFAAWLLILVLIRTFHNEVALWIDLIQALALAIVIASFDDARGQVKRQGHWLHHWLADWSFSLYVIHDPIKLFLVMLLTGSEGGLALQPSWHAFMSFAVVSVCILLSASVFAWLTEFRIERIRFWIYVRLGWKKSTARMTR
ncbi:MAG: acyltransferase family protein, partial [Porticoccaceae bacterium]